MCIRSTGSSTEPLKRILQNRPMSADVLRMNTINVIAPYKHQGMWVFDDPRVGLVQEPFVAGADTIIDRVVADIPDAERGFTLVFSSTPFPGYQHRLDWQREEGGCPNEARPVAQLRASNPAGGGRALPVRALA